jgi:hypothetical protein
VAARCGSSRFQEGSGSGEDAGRALVGDFLFGLEPVLNISTTKVRCAPQKSKISTQLRYNNVTSALNPARTEFLRTTAVFVRVQLSNGTTSKDIQWHFFESR